MLASRAHPMLASALLEGPRTLTTLAAWSLLEALPSLVSGQVIARAIGQGFLAHHPWTGIGWLAVLASCSLAGSWGSGRVYPSVGRLVEPVRDLLVRRLVRGALSSVGSRLPPDASAVSRSVEQTEIVRESLASLLLLTRSVVITLSGTLIGLASLTVAMAPLTLPPVLAGVLAIMLLARPLARRQRAVLLADEHFAHDTATAVGGIRDITACGAQQAMADILTGDIDAQVRATRQFAVLVCARTLVIALGGVLPVILIIAKAPDLIRHGSGAGTIVGAVTYLIQGIRPVLTMLGAGASATVLRLAVALRRLEETSTGAGPAPPDGDARSDTSPNNGALSLRGVSFSYGDATPIVTAFDLEVPDGAHLAVVGPSGVGKSTLADLIVGLRTPDTGQISAGDIPLHQLAPGTACQWRALVPQEAYVFRGTMRENLTWLHPGATDAQIEDAIEAVGLRGLMCRFGSIDAKVDPAALSAGERQLIVLARAYLSPATLIVLDEATSHLDPAAEARAEQAFGVRHGTLVIIGHRIGSASRARTVLFMHGDGVDIGTHQQLLARSAKYQNLIRLA